MNQKTNIIDSELEKELDDDGKLKQRWRNKKCNAKKEGLECKLSYNEYCMLVKEAGLVSSQLGFSGDNFVLGRYNDQGDYIVGNCRFITQKENSDEKNHRPKKLKNNDKNRCKCGNLKDSQAKMCKECYLKRKSTYINGGAIKKPSKEELETLLKSNSYEKIGRMFKVTGKAVAKWAAKYGLR